MLELMGTDDAQQARLRAVLQEIVAELGQHPAAAGLGYKQPRLSQILNNNERISLRMMNAMARLRKCDVADLLGDVRPYETAPVTPRTTGVRDRVATYGTDRPFWRDLPDWPQLLAAAKLEDPDMPEAVWKKIEDDLHYELDEEPTPSTLVGAAVWVRKNTRYWKIPTARPETGGQPAATGTKGKSG